MALFDWLQRQLASARALRGQTPANAPATQPAAPIVEAFPYGPNYQDQPQPGLTTTPFAGISPEVAQGPLRAPVVSSLPAGAPPRAGAPPLWQPTRSAMSQPLTVGQLQSGGRYPGTQTPLAQTPQLLGTAGTTGAAGQSPDEQLAALYRNYLAQLQSPGAS